MKKRTKAGTSKEAAIARRERFIEAYIANGNNGKQAAITAGFSPKTAEVQAVRVLSEVKVKAQLYERNKEIALRFELTTDRAMQELACIALLDPKDIMDEKGELRPLDQMPEHARRAIASFKDKEVKTWDKVAALRTALRQLTPPPGPTVAVQANVSVAHAEVSALQPEQRSILEIGRRLAYALNMAAQAAT